MLLIDSKCIPCSFNHTPMIKEILDFFSHQFIIHQKGTYDDKNQNNWILKIIVENQIKNLHELR